MRIITTLIFVFAASLIFAQNNESHTPTPPNSTGQVFTFVEQMPQFPGGDAGLIKFLQQNVTYPAMERDNDIQGKVFVRFVVDEEGNVTDVQVTKSVSPGLDKEAIRVVNMLPKFTPGTQQGKAVKVYYNLPINFKLSDTGNGEYDRMITEKSAADENFRNGITAFRAGDNKTAIKELTKSAEKAEDGITYLLLSLCYERAADYKNVCKSLKKAVEHGLKGAEADLQKKCK